MTNLHEMPVLGAQQACSPPCTVNVQPDIVPRADGGNVLEGVEGPQHSGAGCRSHKEGHLQALCVCLRAAMMRGSEAARHVYLQ